MSETLDNFFDRSYINHVNGRVLVFANNRDRMTESGINKAQLWTMEQTGEYVKYLQAKEKDEVVI